MMRRDYGTGSITQRPSGGWLIRWSLGNDPITGRHIRRSKTIRGTKVEAQRELARLTAVRRGDSRITVGNLIDVILPNLPITDGSRDDYRYALRHLPEATRQIPAADIHAGIAGDVLRAVAKTAGPQSVRKMRTALQACWRHARTSGWLDGNPWKGHRLPPVSASSGRSLTQDELGRLLAVLEPGVETVWIRLALICGGRPGEYLSACWSGLDIDVLTLVDTKRSKERTIERPVPLDPVTLNLLQQWQTAQKRRALAVGVPLADDPVFISNDPASGVPWRTNYAGSFLWPKLRDRAGLPSKFRLYDLRHTTISTMQADGHDAATVADIAGNNPTMTLRTYSHTEMERKRAAVASMAARLDRRQA